jgi:hypothetical protein
VWEASEEQELPAGSLVSTPSGPKEHLSFSCHIAQDPIAGKHIGCETIFILSLLHSTGLLKASG